ncbi:MAG TPA: SMP-30/gluconolactonase/LRE family protein [Pyrinomonadaceae bacterium]|nr:SMP-30/gluconolactonase/LRE family protein [Pyrinomonadaceae bacterium]
MAGSLTLSSCAKSKSERLPFAAVRTLAGAERQGERGPFDEAFGVAVTRDGTIYFSDGAANRIWQLAPGGAPKAVAENLNTPSAIALDKDGALVFADTGSHTIKRLEVQSGRVAVVAGTPDRAGFADGDGSTAQFNAPVGVTVAPDGTIFVADTYNDRIRAIDREGRVRTIAGGDAPGYQDAASGADARFDTPCGISMDTDGSLIVADTGNHRLRRVSQAGAVTTIAGTGQQGVSDGAPEEASFNEPVGVHVDADGTIYVTDAGASAVRVYRPGLWRQVYTLVGFASAGVRDGTLDVARLARPTGVAVSPDGTLVIADSGNRLVRAVLREGGAQGAELTPEQLNALRPRAEEFRAAAPPRWPYDPPDKPREIAATFGEIRGEIKEGEDAWFHNGLDIPGAYGETARIVRTEKILRPLSVEGVGGARERIRFPTLGYIHLRVGRTQDDRAFDDERFVLRRDDRGKVIGVRVRRGAQFRAGENVGTLNNQNHVHLIAGRTGGEFNALAALELPGVRDTVAPVIENDGVRLFDRDGRELRAPSSSARADSSAQHGEATGNQITVRGDVRVVVRAYDQMDGNAARRRLGLYQLGYQVLKRDGGPAPGFAEPLVTISFESLPDDGRSAPIAYAAGSKSGATGETIFAYIVTNRVREREAAEDYWHTSQLPEGEYLLRIFAADFFGNRTTRDIGVRIAAQ